MKFDLEKYEDALNHLVQRKELSEDSSRTYLSCLNVLHKNCGECDLEKLSEFLIENINSRNQFMKYVSAIRKYEQLVLKQEKGILYGNPEIELFNHFKENNVLKSKVPNLPEDKILRKINGLKNEKLKYALRLQLKSGLRVSEIADLDKNDFEFENGKIKVYVRHGKGNKARKVNVIEDDYLYCRLQRYIDECTEDKLFYTKDSLRKRAAKYGIETHDLRRHNARERMKIEMNRGNTRKKAKKIVQRELGHETTRTTDIYVGEGSEK